MTKPLQICERLKRTKDSQLLTLLTVDTVLFSLLIHLISQHVPCTYNVEDPLPPTRLMVRQTSTVAIIIQCTKSSGTK